MGFKVNDLRIRKVDDSEVDLFRMMAVIWGEKKQILFYSLLTVAGAVLFSYVQPKKYETRMDAFVLPSKGNTPSSKSFLPLEYYDRFSRSPETLKTVLERLPDEVKFEEDILPLDQLKSMLRVKPRITKSAPGLASSALQLTFYVRHTDPSSAYHIARTWQEVLDENFSGFEKSVTASKNADAEMQFSLNKVKTNKAKWEAVKTKIVESKNNNNTGVKLLELNSIRSQISSAYNKIKILKQQIEQSKGHALVSKEVSRISKEVSKINEQYNYKRTI
jgi:hypothetical protein